MASIPKEDDLPLNSAIEVPARPYPFVLDPRHTALVVIDMQREFLEKGGFGESLGYDVARLAGIVPTTTRLIAMFRRRGWPVVHTRETHHPDLSDCPPSTRNRGKAGLRIGDRGAMGRVLVRGEAGNEIIPELAPRPDEIVIDKPGKGMFYDTGLNVRLRNMGITHLVFAGIATEACVQMSMREASDRGYECLLVEDATESCSPDFKTAAIEMLIAPSGIVGWVTPFATLRAALAMELMEA